MDPNTDPDTSLAELQTKLFMAAITGLVELAKTTNQDSIKLRALTQVARLCAPANRAAPPSPKPLRSPQGGGSSGPSLSPDSQPSRAPSAPSAVGAAPAPAPGPE